MPTFSAVHGTDSVCAEGIKKDGFKIVSNRLGELMYGNGVYFYENSPAGEKAACYWPYHWYRSRKPRPPFMRVYVEVRYQDKRYLRWTDKHENQVKQRMAVLRKSTGVFLDDKEKNRQRCKIIADVATKMGLQMDIIFTSFPTDYDPPWNGLPKTPGCVVLNEALLPSPPFNMASCGAS